MIEREYTHAHFFCGLGGGAAGFNRGSARVGSMVAKFRCLGGIDVDPGAIRDFERLAGVPGTAMDLFSREQYLAFHGKEPSAAWREATTADVHRAFQNEAPDIVFLSAPCKGFSGLLSEKTSQTVKYQALNGLTLRGVWLMLEAYKDQPPKLIIFENVPRIATRGRPLVDQIIKLLRAYGYAAAETTHDCGEIGGLAQSRKRFLLVARHVAQVPPFLYEPPKRPLRGVGEILDRLPLPGAAGAGPMHRMPALQWKTWVRLAFVEAGSDWRSLNKLAVEDGFLRDFGILPERDWRGGVLGVNRWDEPSGVVAGRNGSTNGNYAVADPREEHWGGGQAGVRAWTDPAPTITSQRSPLQGSFSVADPRVNGHEKSVQLGVRAWNETAACVKGDCSVGGGPYAVADPRAAENGPRFNNVYRIVPWGAPSPAVTGQGGNSAGAVADPRPSDRLDYKQTKYRVSGYGEAAGTIIAASTTGNGGFAVADPRPVCLNREDREGYASQGHYGVVPWAEPSRAIPAFAKNNNGAWSVADPRADMATDSLPDGPDRLVCVIRALDGTWHRPFTTLELAALQSLFDPEDALEFQLEGASDSAWRERIGNAVPSSAAQAIAGVMGQTLLLAEQGETFMLSAQEIWVRPLAIALAVDLPVGGLIDG